MSRKTKITCHGKTFDTIKEFAEHYGVNRKTIHTRLRAGETPEEAILDRELPNQTPITVDGIEYESMSAACRHYGLTEGFWFDKVSRRIRDGWTIEQAFNLEPPPPREAANNEITVCYGKTYNSHTDLAEAYGLSQTTVSQRIREGMTPEQAVRKPLIPINPNSPGCIYKITNLITLMAYVGLTQGTAESRFDGHCGESSRGGGGSGSLGEAIRLYGKNSFSIETLAESCSLSELMELETHHISKENTLVPKLGGNGYNQNIGGAASGGPKKKYKVGGVTFPSFANACRFHNRPTSTVNNRLLRGWSIEDAFFVPTKKLGDKLHLPFTGKRCISVKINNISYPSVTEACKAYNLERGFVYQRMKSNKNKNRSPEEIIKEVIEKKQRHLRPDSI
jgi:hypothetical protein|tara:strand:- start:1387 stop:2565 length:1179 start_codon:yes stop_codon:yes gene_type:complete